MLPPDLISRLGPNARNLIFGWGSATLLQFL